VDVRDRRVGIIGTGSSGAQAIPVLANDAKHLYVFQRHPHWAVPAQNRVTEDGLQDAMADELEPDRKQAFLGGGPPDARRMRASPGLPRPSDDYTVKEQEDLLEAQWAFGGHGMSYLFSDERSSPASNGVVADFVRQKVRQRVTDPVLAEKLCPRYPFGTRRLILEIGYYEAFNHDNVTLVDVLEDPIVELDERGVRTARGVYEVDLLVFAIGFQSFLGPLEAAGIRNESGHTPRDVWARGPRTLFGLMTPGFPNLFHPTNAGSPSVLGNAMLQHEFFGDWITDCIKHVDKSGYSSVEASEAAADAWTLLVDSYAQRLLPLRRQENQYMVHVNDDGSRLFIPFCAGMAEYLPKVNEATARNYEGFRFS
jgi:cation diffusion facilitator CzcD-associated flavoprotein CzcO